MPQHSLKLNIRRLAAMLLTLALLFTAAPAARADAPGGDCGDSLTWSLEDGTLTITGSGPMWNFDEPDMAPWDAYRDRITAVSLPEGLTTVGNMAFYHCSRLAAVQLPAGVTSVGRYAFAGCTGLVMLQLGQSLTTIGHGAFYDCRALPAVTLPATLQTIDTQAFYRCESLAAVTIPASVQSMGSSAFAYCKSLVRAELQSTLTALPDWTFYGCSLLSTVILPDTVSDVGNAAFRQCDSLYTVYFGGQASDAEQLKDDIAAELPGFGVTGNLTEIMPEGPAVSGGAHTNSDGTVTEQTSTVQPGQNSSVSAEVTHTHPEGNRNSGIVGSDIIVKVDNTDGWDEVIEPVKDALSDLHQRTPEGATSEKASVTVYVQDGSAVDPGFIEALAGRNAMLTVVNPDGASWKIDCSTMSSRDLSGVYDLRYTLQPADADLCTALNVQTSWTLRFEATAVVNAEVLVRLPDAAIRQHAALFQRTGSEWQRVQTVVVDQNGYAHFYLAAVDDKTEYAIALNPPAAEGEDEAAPDVIIPQELASEYGQPEPYIPIQYRITGRTSSWNMTIGQVTGIMVAVLVVVVAGVGVTMFALNRQKLSMGYTPGWDDAADDEDE